MRTADRIEEFRQRRKASKNLGAKEKYRSRRTGLASPEGISQAAEDAMEGIKDLYKERYSSLDKWMDSIEDTQKGREVAELAPEQVRLGYDGITTRALEEVTDAPIRPMPRWDGVKGFSGGTGGREAAEQYLGREMSDEEWEFLTRTTYAEATNNKEEQAAIMSVILNRAKSKQYPDSVVDVVNQKNQFQAVTGTKSDPGPSDRFRSFSEENLNSFEEEVTPMLSSFQGQGWLNFTAANPDAYGPGTNIGFLEEVMNSENAAKIGGTIFGTLR